MRESRTTSHTGLTARDLSFLANQKVLFGHQSIGDDLVRGLHELMASEPVLKLRIVSSADPQLIAGPAFVECHFGRNGDPQSKAEAFAAIVDKGMGREGGIALFKYCYVDIGASTDVGQVFEWYRHTIDTLKSKYPLLRIVHVTIPLTTIKHGVKSWVKSRLGRVTERDINRKRNEYNCLLLQEYSGTDPVFDLAAIESTRPDGSRSGFIDSGQWIPALVPEFTNDGGHLNEAGRRAAAEHLLLALSKFCQTEVAMTQGVDAWKE